MSQCVIKEEIMESEHWKNFFESIAAGMHLNFVLITEDGSIQKAPCNHSDHTTIEQLLDAADFEYNTHEGSAALHLHNGLPAAVITLKYGQKIIATECSRSMLNIANSPLEERLSLVADLVNFVQTVLLERNDGDKSDTDMAAIRDLSRRVLSIGYGKKHDLTRSFEVILCLLSLLLYSEGSWLEFNVFSLPELVIEGNRWFLEEFPLKQDYSDTLTVDINNGTSLGKLNVIMPEDPEQAERLLTIVAEECLMAIENDKLYRLLHSNMDIILGSVATGITLIDKYGMILSANAQAKLIFEEENDQFIGSKITDFPGPWNRSIALEEGASAGGEKVAVRRKSGQADPIYVDWRIYPLVEGCNTMGWVLTVDDRTEYYRHLATEHEAENNAAIAGMVGTLAHELRNPITAASGLLQLMSRKKDADQTRNYIGLVLKELERVTRLLNEFLLLGRPFNTFNTDIKPIDPVAFIKELIPLFQGEAIDTNSSIILEADTVTPIAADPGQLTQVMLNLVRNALQAADKGGTIIVRLQERKGWVCIEVLDDGPGIPEEVMNSIFLPFFTTKERGTGLGLSVVQTIIHNHGGTITAENRPEGGAIFTILFPPAIKKKQEIKELLDVLIIMDENQFNHLLRCTMHNMGAKVLTIPDINRAKETANSILPILVIIGTRYGESNDDIAKLSRVLWPDSKLMVFVPNEPYVSVVREKSEAAKTFNEDGVMYIKYPADLTKVSSMVKKILGKS